MGGAEYHNLFWAAAKSTYEGQWEENMEQLKKLDEGAWSWLMRIPKERWTRHAMGTHPVCDILLNNNCEVFNSRILQAREKPIISMLELIRQYMLDRWMTNREKLEKYNGDIMPKIRKKLERRILHSAKWTSRWSGDKCFEVSHRNYRFIVNLDDKTCSCRAWQLCGVPCPHAISAIYYIGAKPEEFVSNFFTREAYEKCYTQLFSPLNGADMWPRTAQNQIDPPPLKRKKAGRPKKKRRIDPLDERAPGQESGKLTRKGITMRCSRCGHVGHNTRTCDVGK